MWTYQTFQGEGCRKMYGYQGKGVGGCSAQGAVKVFSAGRWRLFRAGAGAGFHNCGTLQNTDGCSARARARGTWTASI